MGNGYDVLLCDVIETFLLTPSVQLKRAVTLRRTNLYDIVQNSNKRVAILIPSVRLSSSSPHTKGVPLSHPVLASLVSHPPDDCQGHQDGLLPQPGDV